MTTSETITYFFFILSPISNLFFWLYQLIFRKAVFAHLFSFSPFTLILKLCEVAETIYASSSPCHFRIHRGKGMLCLLTPFCYINTPTPAKLHQYTFPTCLPPKKYHHWKAEEIVLVSLRFKTMRCL